MKIDILTIFPEMFGGPFATSMLKKAQDEGLVKINIHDLRNWANDTHKSVDDRPYGGGPGMILSVDVIDNALIDLKSEKRSTKSETNPKFQILNFKQDKKQTNHKPHVILLSAKGKTYNQQLAKKYSNLKHIILISGHYEDIDARVSKYLVDEDVSIGDYILTGGEIPAMVLVDSVVRLIPGVLGAKDGLDEESHSTPGYIEYPQYTRPEEYKGWKVPQVLLSGNHKEIETWRSKNSKTKKR